MSTAPTVAFHCRAGGQQHSCTAGHATSQPFLLCSELTGQNSRHCAAAIEGLDTDVAPLDLAILHWGNYIQWLGGRLVRCGGGGNRAEKRGPSSAGLLTGRGGPEEEIVFQKASPEAEVNSGSTLQIWWE